MVSDIYFENKRCKCGSLTFTHAPKIKGIQDPKWVGHYICTTCSKLHRPLPKQVLDSDDLRGSVDYLISTTRRGFEYLGEPELAQEFTEIMAKCKTPTMVMRVLESFVTYSK